MTKTQIINIIALKFKSIIDIIIICALYIIEYINNIIKEYLNKYEPTRKQIFIYKTHGIVYLLIQMCAIYVSLPFNLLSPFYCSLAIYSLEYLTLLGLFSKKKLKNKYKLLNYFYKTYS
ncbi:hypothetical protein BcabD6B2_58910 (apicoplast) [Babesia caballi]|uniref:Uncharacterized protein n=1 Tax=Babesia caballi TaxID=5871 RepID=A0AAV4M3B7_BABCB|nr:hypothetical protein BcabD6B2_58900 [Babesia caballi]GIX66454.1 hypothetical protein BcabD6B2_58910 [Babesia caballi]